MQYQHWALYQNVPAQDVWFFHVREWLPLTAPARLSDLCHRQVAKVWRAMEKAAVSELGEDYLPDQLPPWMPQLAEILTCCLVPTEFIPYLERREWNCIALPSPYTADKRFKAPAWFCREHLDAKLCAYMQGTQNVAALAPVEAFSLTRGDELNCDLRAVLHGTQAPATLLPWIIALQRFNDEAFRAAEAALTPSMTAMIEFVLLADHLKSNDRLKVAMLAACKATLPSGIYESLRPGLELHQAPDKHAISRFHLTMDTATMLLARVANWKEFDRGSDEDCRYVTWDSSPQFHRDYELALADSIRGSDLCRALQLSDLLVRRAKAGDSNLRYQESWDAHVAEMGELRALIRNHQFPGVQIGFGASTFDRKLKALLHAFRLEHFNDASLAHWVRGVIAVISDDGTERLFPRVRQCAMPEGFSPTGKNDRALVCAAVDITGQVFEDPVFEDPERGRWV